VKNNVLGFRFQSGKISNHLPVVLVNEHPQPLQLRQGSAGYIGWNFGLLSLRLEGIVVICIRILDRANYRRGNFFRLGLTISKVQIALMLRLTSETTKSK
jgi:hypothetical protein